MLEYYRMECVYMDRIDWNVLRNSVVENQRKNHKDDKKTQQEKPVNYSLKINDSLVEIEVKKEDVPNNHFAIRRRLLAYCNYFQCMEYKTEEVKELYKAIFDFLLDDYQHFCNAMKEDINELDICYSSGAYKATIILAGSILEAFLLEWLSENDGKNYFEEPYKIKVFKEDGTYMWKKREQLNVYIDQIKEIEKPDWMELSEKAHYIRKNRNSVHAKVCLKQEIDINEEICEKVITYLNDIIKSRLNKKKQELNFIEGLDYSQ